MKSFVKLGVLVMAVMGMTACVNDLNTEPIDKNSTTAFNQDAVFSKCYATLALTGQKGPDGDCDIDDLDEGTSSFYRMMWELNEFCSDEGWWIWNDVGLADIRVMNWNGDNALVKGLYYRLNIDIKLCNHFLEHASTDELGNIQRAEVRFIRALNYWYMLDMFKVAPLSTKESTELPEFVEREALYTWLVGELNELTEILPEQRLSVYRVDKYAAWLLLARTYLNAEVYTGTPMWEKCIEQCDSIINGGYGYMLNPDYFTTFKKENTANMEIIFPIVFDQVYAKGNMFHLITLHYVHQEVYGFTTATWNGPCTLESFYNKYADNDKRKAQWLVGAVLDDAGDTIMYDTGNKAIGDNGKLPAVITPKITKILDATKANSFEGARFVKFEPEFGIEHHANSDFPIYRYADILLMKAECLMRLNGGVANGDALALVNQVHTRAGLEPYTTLDLEELLNERGRELAWEGHRRQDLIRFGKYAEGKWEFMDKDENGAPIDASYRNDHVNIFPIPEWVMTANPGVYTQNPGYE